MHCYSRNRRNHTGPTSIADAVGSEAFSLKFDVDPNGCVKKRCISPVDLTRTKHHPGRLPIRYIWRLFNLLLNSSAETLSKFCWTGGIAVYLFKRSLALE